MTENTKAQSQFWLVGPCSAMALLALAGCTVGPKYTKPTTQVPAEYKEASANFKAAQPRDEIAKGKWWEVYGDPQLNIFEEQVTLSNQNLKAEAEVFAQAQAAIRVQRAPLYPSVTAGINGSQNRQSQTSPTFGPTSPVNYGFIQLPAQVSWEPDLWGRVRRSVEAARSEAQATAADLANLELSLHAELAVDYFELRGLDTEKRLLDSTVVSYQEALDLTQSRYRGGIASAVDVAQAQTQLETTRAEDADVDVQRAAFEHAIAVLTGKPPYELTLPLLPLNTPPPAIPPGLPSELLERRPDIAAAERRVQEANAQIGVAKAAYFPTITLGGAGGYESQRLGNLLSGASGFWSLAGSASELIFDGGARRGITQEAWAAFNESVDNYRQTTLTAFQEVEDNLSALRVLEGEAKTEDAAVAAAQHSLDLSNSRYRGGVANYLEVTTAQSAALADEVTAVDILTRRMTASVQLIEALGGGWNVSQIPAL
jgi:NodT family efflux transporter outer membrane factor (OMF) lipoprotein